MLKERAKYRKNFLPALVIVCLLVGVWLTVFFFVPPELPFLPVLFLVLTFLSFLFIWSLVLANTRRGFLIGSGVSIFMVLGHYGAGTWLNFILIMSILVVLEYYLSR